MAEDGGDSTELSAWFVGEYQRLVRFATVVCGDLYVAEDLVQEAYLRVRLAGADTRKFVHAYVRRTIVNLSRSRFRRKLAEQRATQRVVATEAILMSERDDMVWSALMRLSSRQRAVIALHYYEDLADADVAAVLGISEGSVRQHRSRGLAHLRRFLEEGK